MYGLRELILAEALKCQFRSEMAAQASQAYDVALQEKKSRRLRCKVESSGIAGARHNIAIAQIRSPHNIGGVILALVFAANGWNNPRDDALPRERTFHTSRPTHERASVLFDQIRQNDATALTELMRMFGLRLAGIAAALLGSDDAAEEVVQDVFISLWERRNALVTPQNVGGYLYQAVRNRALQTLRHEHVQRRLQDNLITRNPAASHVAANAAEEALHAEDVKAQLDAMLRDVPPQPRKAFLLHWDAGLTYAEIAELMGITVASVHKLMYRATQRLAQLLPNRRFDG